MAKVIDLILSDRQLMINFIKDLDDSNRMKL
jgi:hypothetical protein